METLLVSLEWWMHKREVLKVWKLSCRDSVCGFYYLCTVYTHTLREYTERWYSSILSVGVPIASQGLWVYSSWHTTGFWVSSRCVQFSVWQNLACMRIRCAQPVGTKGMNWRTSWWRKESSCGKIGKSWNIFYVSLSLSFPLTLWKKFKAFLYTPLCLSHGKKQDFPPWLFLFF